MGTGFKTAYGLEIDAGRLVLARAVRRALDNGPPAPAPA